MDQKMKVNDLSANLRPCHENLVRFPCLMFQVIFVKLDELSK